MTSVRFDHFITYTSAASIDDYLREYAELGFAPEERTVRHDPGLRNGFVFIGPEYLEFCWVENETLFETADEEDRLLRATPRPFGLGMVADDVQAVHNDWMARGFATPEVSLGKPRDADPDTPPVWSFQEIPSELLPGILGFALTYHLRAKDAERLVQVAPNTVYAISGATFVTPEPEARATCWRDLLAPGEPIRRLGAAFSVRIGPHWAEWRTPGAYQSKYGLDWTPHPLLHGELALLHLLATDVQAVKTLMEQAGRRSYPVSVAGGEALLLTPDVRDGFVFVVRQQPVETWHRERVGRTGERLRLSQD